jgi:hypothetical protein
MARPMSICHFLLSPDFKVIKAHHTAGQKKINLSSDEYDDHLFSIRKTLSGNLSTVERLENKWKATYRNAHNYLSKVISSQDNLAKIPRNVRNPIKSFQKLVGDVRKGKYKNIGSRDPPPPPGAQDHTFTYYTKAIKDVRGAKHQFRVRSYVREINYKDMKMNVPILGYDEVGNIVELTRIPYGQSTRLQIRYMKKTHNGLEEVKKLSHLSRKEVTTQLGGRYPPTLYAYPHGKGFKLEVKSKLPDTIEGDIFPNLNGQNFVQKLDLPLTWDELKILFGERRKGKYYQQQIESIKEQVRKRAVQKYPEVGNERVDAFFKLYQDALSREPNFHTLAGATEYQRFAFEINVPDKVAGKGIKLQTTFDYNQGARFVYNKQGKLLNPLETFDTQTKLPNTTVEPLHVEFKAPKVLVEKAAVNPESVSEELGTIMRIFNDSKPNNISRGKFNFIMGDY